MERPEQNDDNNAGRQWLDRIYPGYPSHPSVAAIGRVRISEQTYELLEDYRMAVLTFAAATKGKEVEDAYAAMEMRRRELTVHISAMEKYAGTEQKKGMQF